MNGTQCFAGKLPDISRITTRVIMCGFVLAIFGSVPLLAALVSQDFTTSDSLPIGTIVSIGASSSEVVRASSSNLDNLYGIVTRAGDISIDSGKEGIKTVSVANSDVVNTLVSVANGPISRGDIISVSDIAGVGEKLTLAGPGVGVAQEDFNDNSSSAQSIEAGGKTLKAGLIQMKLGITNYQYDEVNNQKRNPFERIADSIAGKRVSLITLLVAASLLLGGVIIASFLIASSGYASMTALGRNPLSEKKIVRLLLRMVSIALAVFGITVIMAFGALKFL